MRPLKDFIFGDYSGLREYTRDPELFVQSFVEPSSLSLGSLRRNGNFIIVGRKGTGKSSCCLTYAHRLSKEGYVTTFFNFSEDLTRLDLKEAVQTQSINLSDISTKKLFDSIVEWYDFRDLWIRKVIHRIATSIVRSGGTSSFTKFATSVSLSESSIAEGVGRGLSLPLNIENWKETLKGLKLPSNGSSTLSLHEYNEACLQLIQEYHPGIKFFFFFDELNLSHVKSDSSEYNTLLALVRDVLRASAFLNDWAVRSAVDLNVVCSIRPEVRRKILSLDSEMSKLVDSNSVDLSWPFKPADDNPLISLLKNKLHQAGTTDEEFNKILPDRVRSIGGSSDVEFAKFFLNITWYRPRDVVRVLKCYQSTNGSETVLFSRTGDQLRFLKEYSRVSGLDCYAELEVKYQGGLLRQALQRINKPVFSRRSSLVDALLVLQNRLNVEELIDDLFDAGVIINHQKNSSGTHVYAAYRGDSALDPEMRIIVHRGLQADLHLGFQAIIDED